MLYYTCAYQLCNENNFTRIKYERYDSIIKFGYCFDESFLGILAFINPLLAEYFFSSFFVT